MAKKPKTLNVRSASDAKINCPDSGVEVGRKGAEVPATKWWRRRIRAGQAVDLDAEKRAKSAAAQADALLSADNNELRAELESLAASYELAQNNLVETASELQAAKKRITELEAELKKLQK